MVRDLNKEYQDSDDRQYAYNFDYVHRDFMLRSFEPHFTPMGRALEMGCYKGEFTKKLLNHFDDITVVEGSSDLIDIAQENVNNDTVTFINSLFEEWVPDTKYDAIFLIHTLEHLDHPVNVLRKIKSALSDKGYLFLVVPNANAASRQIAVKMGLISHNDAVTDGEREHGHRITYNSDTLKRDVDAAGLDVVSHEGIFFKPFANFQFDKLLDSGAIDMNYMEGCYQLGHDYPDLSASIFFLCR